MRTQYTSRTRLLNAINNEEIDDYFVLNSAEAVVRDYPNCKYYIFDISTETFKPSKRK